MLFVNITNEWFCVLDRVVLERIFFVRHDDSDLIVVFLVLCL